MTLLLVVLSLVTLFSLSFSIIACYVCYKTLRANFEMQDKMKEYNRFFTLMMDTLQNDTGFLRSTLLKKMSLEVPETREVNSALIKFQDNLEAIRNTLRAYKMTED